MDAPDIRGCRGSKSRSSSDQKRIGELTRHTHASKDSRDGGNGAMTWDELEYWRLPEWETVQEKLAKLRTWTTVVPKQEDMFRALDLSPYEKTKVMILGQDPYPNPEHATGVAFSLPMGYPLDKAPQTWQNLKREYCTDLHLGSPITGSLERWAIQGVLLWNVCPTTFAGQPGMHDWPEYQPLTKEIVSELSKKGVVFVFLGAKARRYLPCCSNWSLNKAICTSHPSNQASHQHRNSQIPAFFGSRIFSLTNAFLNQLGKEPINWNISNGQIQRP